MNKPVAILLLLMLVALLCSGCSSNQAKPAEMNPITYGISKAEADRNGDTYCKNCDRFIAGKVRICPNCGQYI